MIQPFRINISKEIIANLQEGLSATRWVDEFDNDKWEMGTNGAYLKKLCNYWQTTFDWQKQVEEINSFSNFRTEIDGINIHFIHEKGESENATPLLLIHGWPDSFVRFLNIIPLLTKPDKKGHSFNVVVPSIPGYAFSDKPVKPGMNPKKIASLFADL